MSEVEKILKETNDGLDVFEHYLGIEITHKLFKNSFRSDTTASCKLKKHKGRYILHDYGSSEWNGDCFHFVGKIIGKSCITQFKDILNTIIKDLQLNLENNFESHRDSGTDIRKKRDINISQETYAFTAHCRSYNDPEIKYWQQYGISEEILQKYSVLSVSRCHFTKSDKQFNIYSSLKSPTFGYFFNEGKGIKLYRPKNEVRFLYAGILPKPYIFGYDQLPRQGENIFITGGEKDVLSLSAHGLNAICFNSETSLIPINIIKDLQPRFHSIIIMYDSDKTGIRESEQRLQELKKQGVSNIYRVVLPLSGKKTEKDISDYFSMGNTVTDLLLHLETSKK